MAHMVSSRLTLIAGVAVAAALLGGCSASGSELTVSKADLESTAKEKLEAAAGQKSQGVECEGGVAGKVGATQRCVLTAEDGSTIGVTATVGSVEGTTVNVNFKADDAPSG